MTQADYEIGADEPGLDYRAADNLGKQALLTCHKGTARPAYAEPGTLWIKDPGSGTLWTVYLYDGTLDLVVGYLMISGAADPQFIAAGSSFYVESTTRTGVNFDITSGYGLLGLKKGDRFVVRNNNASPSGAGAGLKIDALTAVQILKDGVDLGGGALEPLNEGDILGNAVFEAVYNGTNFILLTPAASGFQGFDSVSRGETLTTAHRGRFLWVRADLGSGAIVLPDPAVTDGFGFGTFIDMQYFMTSGDYGDVLIDAATGCTIDGETAIPLRPGQGFRIVSDGNDYYTLRGKAEGFSSKNVVRDTGSISADHQSGQVYIKTATATITLPDVTKISDGWCAIIKNESASGIVTIATFGAELIDGSASLAIYSRESCAVFFNGTNFYSVLNGGNSRVLLAVAPASASPALEFTGIDATYDQYAFKLVNVIPATNADSILMRFSQDGGSSFLAGSNYSHGATGSTNNTTNAGGSATGTGISLTSSATSNAASAGICGEVNLWTPSNSVTNKSVSFSEIKHVTGAGTNETCFGGGRYTADTNAVNAVQFIPASGGDITSGTIYMYGIRN